jgi:hypothetical protein
MLFGADAITLSRASNRQCEVLVKNSHWKGAGSLSESTRAYRDDPTTVRIMAPLRILAEDVLRQSITQDADVPGALASAAADPTTNDLEQAAIAILQRESLT